MQKKRRAVKALGFLFYDFLTFNSELRLTIIESMYLENNPGISSDDVKLSAWYFKESTGSDKLEGTIIDAFDFHLKKFGLVSRSDYSRSDSGEVLKTNFLGERMTPQSLRKKLVGDRTFWAYAISSKLSGWHASPDPDAMPGTKAFFIPKESINSIIRKSLLQKVPVGFWFDTHVVVIYGAEYDTDNIATKYYIKDSYSPYFYEKTADWVHQNIIVLTAPANLQ